MRMKKMASVKNVNMQFKNKKLILARNRVFGTTTQLTDALSDTALVRNEA